MFESQDEHDIGFKDLLISIGLVIVIALAIWKAIDIGIFIGRRVTVEFHQPRGELP